MMMESVMKTS